jgi:hypothetical protein
LTDSTAPVQPGATWTDADRRRTRRAALAGGVGTLIDCDIHGAFHIGTSNWAVAA